MALELQKNIGLALLRIAAASMFMTHGLPKFLNLIDGNVKFADPIGIGEIPSLILVVIAEFICPFLIIIGYKTRWAAIPPAITMIVAAFIVHGADSFKKKENAIVYLVFFVVILLLGPGKFSIDKK